MLTKLEAEIRHTFAEGNVCVLWRSTSGVSSEVFSHWTYFLSEDEVSKTHKLQCEEDRNSYIAAHALLRQSLSVIGNTSPHSWRFSTSQNGKPRVVSTPELPEINVNLSHTHGMVVVSLSKNFDVGVDVEKLDRDIELEFWDYVLEENESQGLSRLPEHRRVISFIELWTIKEALLKASGQGLTVKMNKISCALNPGRLLDAGPLPKTGKDWKIWQFQLAFKYSLAVAVNAPGTVELFLTCIEAPPAFDGQHNPEKVAL